MNDENLLKVALRYKALYLDIEKEDIDMSSKMTPVVYSLTERLRENGFCLSEELLHALDEVPVAKLADIVSIIEDVMGVGLNWSSLVKGWDMPTGEGVADHFITWVANIIKGELNIKGTTLPCGHLIPDGTFPLERYNGCPFCGTPFKTTNYVYKGQGSKLKELRLLNREDLKGIFLSLLTSPTPLDTTQKDSLNLLLNCFEVPEGTEIGMKETMMLVIKHWVSTGQADRAMDYFKTPTDILRYLWFEKTGHVQIIKPSTLMNNARRLGAHMNFVCDKSLTYQEQMKQQLMLKYSRKNCKTVSKWINNLPLSAIKMAEDMNSKRGMWVRFIRALRLAEFAKRKGYEKLADVMDIFYKQNYTTWQGNLDQASNNNQAEKVLGMLKERPGSFARCLFATMLRFGSLRTLKAFGEIADELPARLLVSLGNAAEGYYDIDSIRSIKTITGIQKIIPHNKLLALYSKVEREKMIEDVNGMYKDSMFRRFKAQDTESKTIYIAPELYDIPISVGDRSTTIQDTSCALMGTRFPMEGDAVRLFLQWGKGLHAQHLDMDLSCRISYEDKIEECAYYNLTCTGAKHSGDIRSIPEMVGTAEYIELSLPELEAAEAKYAIFTCNAYSCGSLSPNLVVGWMNSANKMKISEKDGVAYDPSCVQHMVRVADDNLSKGLVFGVLDIAKREIIWLEMPIAGQTLRSARSKDIEALLIKLQRKLKIGELLKMKAEAQSQKIVGSAEQADESYTHEWAFNPAEVSKLLY